MTRKIDTAPPYRLKLALVEEVALRDPRLVFRRHLDVRGRQQEDLVRDSVDGAMEPEDQARREVYETARITIDHLSQVHNNWCALAKVLTYCPCLVVGARVQRGDPGQVGRVHGLRDGALIEPAPAVVAGVRGLGHERLGMVGILGDVVAVIVALAVFVGVGIVVAMVVFDQAEIDRHLAHRAGHRESSVTRCSPGSRRVLRVGHYLTNASRLPSNAVPTRTCVAPSAIASSRSPVMPAEIIIAPG